MSDFAEEDAEVLDAELAGVGLSVDGTQILIGLRPAGSKSTKHCFGLSYRQADALARLLDDAIVRARAIRTQSN